MDRSWIDLSKYDPAYVSGVGKFIEFAFNDKAIGAIVCCPCKKCRNRYNKSKNDILVHCVMNGFYTNYKNWVYHGEALNLQRHNHENLDNPIPNDASDNMVQLVQEAMGFHSMGADHRDDDLSTNERASEADEETNKFFKLLEDAKADVYAGNKKFSKLSLIVRILQSKALCGWTDKSVDIILEMLQDLLPSDAKVPKSCYEAKKLINDFGFSYETWDACPNNCMLFRLEHCRKDCYMGHRRFLPSGHRFRRDTVSFDGKREIGRAPLLQSGSEVFQELDKYQILTQYKKEDMLKRRAGLGDEKSDEHNWKKRSIFFELPYWEHNLIRHNLNVMHVEKNVCDNILWTLLGDKKKSKDHRRARLQLKSMNIRKPLWPQPRPSGRDNLPPTAFTMGRKEKDIFCKALKSIRAPDGYASNIARRVNIASRTIIGLKSHDNHVLIQQLIPIATRRALPIHPAYCIHYKGEKKCITKGIDIIHNATFHDWFKSYVHARENTDSFSEETRRLSYGPMSHGKSYNACIVNNFRFRTKSHDERKAIQNSGATLRASTNSYASAKDKNPLLGEVPYYGILTDIIEIQYAYNMKFILFKCDWVDNDKGGLVEDIHKFKLVNFSRLMYKNNLPSDEPFILSNQAEQVWYVSDPVDPDLSVTVTMARRDDFDVYSRMFETELYGNQVLDDHIPLNDDDANWVRDGVEGTLVDANDSEHYDEVDDCDEVD
ncbi:hypothetical protein BUALT_Bualt09G0019600 [Buddleja alternifolia]|uniref:Transposase n=1 Tax=Buddleja alternifolia TaxID=168488 RepID=A0AAV6X6F6_9LAMI|nr:hypothetical protein BUALT_Bualt09G0019600 [Buddleja alternifolia]